jgi:hypothetical protein
LAVHYGIRYLSVLAHALEKAPPGVAEKRRAVRVGAVEGPVGARFKITTL